MNRFTDNSCLSASFTNDGGRKFCLVNCAKTELSFDADMHIKIMNIAHHPSRWTWVSRCCLHSHLHLFQNCASSPDKRKNVLHSLFHHVLLKKKKGMVALWGGERIGGKYNNNNNSRISIPPSVVTSWLRSWLLEQLFPQQQQPF